MRTADFLSFIPQAKSLIGIISRIIGTSLQYVDEAVLSYTMRFEKNGRSVWRNSGDGIVYYAQSWKGILKTAVIIVALKAAIWWGSFFGGMFLISSIVTFEGNLAVLNILPLIFGFFLASGMSKAFVDPIATALMIKEFHKNIENKELSFDLSQKIYDNSSKFRQLISKEKEETKQQNIQ
ncbi:hypothetical protein [Bacillus sp. JCM 19034]|uniref:hypothetical protein n=1 Tax=Bacillus sp. JCM 19034 TaxID=1481928 RepID=UPI0007828566|nr:hypothetical protein [Bacillus sp. JCM 19034]